MIRLAFLLALFTSPAWALSSIRAVDGDTIEFAGQTVRIIGLDAPETRRAQCQDERRRGLLAKWALADLLASGEVRMIKQRRRDRYGRILARLTVDGRDVAAVMISQGHARPYDGGKRQGWC